MKRVLYLSFYFEPDLCAGSFRNSPLAKELANQLGEAGEVVVITTQPNRYKSFEKKAEAFEDRGNLKIHRIDIPQHQSGFKDQINSFRVFYKEAKKIAAAYKYDLVFASSSRLFTAFLGHRLAKSSDVPLYLDIRDIFVDTMDDVLKSPVMKAGVMPILKIVEKITFSNARHINLISGGFKGYFSRYRQCRYTEFSNGIDEVFLNQKASSKPEPSEPLKIVYAGNIGEGQGLHKVIAQAAAQLGSKYQFTVIGDGGAKQKLEEAIKREKVDNVSLHPPVNRQELLKIYSDSDYLFMHLNDYDAFKKVLPSKVFELGAYDKPIIAGVSGYAADFVKQNVPNTILFAPGDFNGLVEQLKAYQYKTEFRTAFIRDFKRSSINEKMASSILEYLD